MNQINTARAFSKLTVQFYSIEKKVVKIIEELLETLDNLEKNEELNGLSDKTEVFIAEIKRRKEDNLETLIKSREEFAARNESFITLREFVTNLEGKIEKYHPKNGEAVKNLIIKMKYLTQAIHNLENIDKQICFLSHKIVEIDNEYCTDMEVISWEREELLKEIGSRRKSEIVYPDAKINAREKQRVEAGVVMEEERKELKLQVKKTIGTEEKVLMAIKNAGMKLTKEQLLNIENEEMEVTRLLLLTDGTKDLLEGQGLLISPSGHFYLNTGERLTPLQALLRGAFANFDFSFLNDTLHGILSEHGLLITSTGCFIRDNGETFSDNERKALGLVQGGLWEFVFQEGHEGRRRGLRKIETVGDLLSKARRKDNCIRRFDVTVTRI